MVNATIFTIGHSTRPLEEFIELLTENGIRRLVDVRKLPGSTKFPHFNADSLGAELAGHGIDMTRLEALTGRRPVSREIPFETNGWWQNRSFHNYADHALSDEFVDAIKTLQQWGKVTPTVVMCSEAVWWRCHRRLIADHVMARNSPVKHIMAPGKTVAAEVSAGAVVADDGVVTYPQRA